MKGDAVLFSIQFFQKSW